MKVLFDHSSPFLLAHGGFQIQIEQTRAALKQVGVEVDFLRWWDDGQAGDIIHYFGRPFTSYVDLAHRKSIKVVFTALHSSLGIRSAWKRRAQKALIRTAEKVLPSFLERLSWESYRAADACIALTPWEAQLVREMFDAPPDKVYVVPNGVEEVFFAPRMAPSGKWLVTTASILPVKRIVETARAAVLAETPYWVIGKPMGENEAYYRDYSELCRANPKILRYEGPIADRAKLAEVYREARGFILLSDWESLSISALEAAAAQCPLLLSDLPWARTAFGDQASYCPTGSSTNATAESLRQFYANAVTLKPPEKPKRWVEVAQQLKAIYESLLTTS